MLQKLYSRIRRAERESRLAPTVALAASADARDRLIKEARSLSRAAKPQQAMALLRPWILETPADAELLYAQADVLFDWGRYREAAVSFHRATQLGITHASIALRHAWAQYWSRNIDEAARLMLRASEDASTGWAPHFGLGIIAMSREDWTTAGAHLRDALDRDPANPACLANLANVSLRQDDVEGCIANARRALASEPESVGGLTPLAIALAKAGQTDESLAAFAEVLRVDKATGTDSSGLQNLANAMIESARIDPAIALLEKELPKCPSAGAYANYAIALLAAGRFADGWPLYEYRWVKEPLRSARFELAVPAWNGQDLDGKHILVRSEQGIGDVVQFARYLPLLKSLGATVHFQRRKGMGGLDEALPGIDHFIEGDVSAETFAYYVNLLSLPRLFATAVERMPTVVPYLRADALAADRWRQRVSTRHGTKVGVVWSGDPKHVRDRGRSIPLALLAPLLQVRDVSFFSLQKGAAAEQLKTIDKEGVIVDIGTELTDWQDTLAVLCNLDLVVTVDTSIAHVAGAMGIRTWVLLAIPTDFRWLESRPDSPWYPTMQLFRQRERGDWRIPVIEVTAALRHLTRQASAPMSVAPATSRARRIVPKFSPHGGIGSNFFPVIEGREGIFQYDATDDPCGISLGWYGEYLNDQVRTLTGVIAAGAWVLEIGAGVGAHAVPLGRMIGENGHLLLWESDAIRRRFLVQNLESNQIPNFTLLRCGAPTSVDTHCEDETVDGLFLQRVDWLKISARRDAYAALRGADQTLWAKRPKVYASFAESQELGATAAYLAEHGYNCWTAIVPLYNPHNFFRVAENRFGDAAEIALLAIPEEIDVDVELANYRPISA